MICPNDNIQMREVTVLSHYDLPVILDQCPSCGGIWFDKAELHRAKAGEAEKVDQVDSTILADHSSFNQSPLRCPRDRAELIRFTDRFFPRDVVLVRCPVCGGIWLNRGGFTKYQKRRREMQQARLKRPRDSKFEEDIRQILESNRGEDNIIKLGNLGKFLSTPVDVNGTVLAEPVEEPTGGNRSMDIVLSLLSLIMGVVTRGRFF